MSAIMRLEDLVTARSQVALVENTAPFIFISYRRAETSDVVGRLREHLGRQFGGASIFRDVGSIRGGDPYATSIENALDQCDACLAVMGENWVTARNGRGGGIENTDDDVRREIAGALARPRIRLIPIFVGNAKMPLAALLPSEIAPLAGLHGLPLRPDPDFVADANRIAAAIRGEWDDEENSGRLVRTLRVARGPLLQTIVVGLLVHAGAALNFEPPLPQAHSWAFAVAGGLLLACWILKLWGGDNAKIWLVIALISFLGFAAGAVRYDDRYSRLTFVYPPEGGTRYVASEELTPAADAWMKKNPGRSVGDMVDDFAAIERQWLVWPQAGLRDAERQLMIGYLVAFGAATLSAIAVAQMLVNLPQRPKRIPKSPSKTRSPTQ